ncbi:GrpB-like predicted nucleotidyltransferase (UPF0157 family) [Paenibacillus endophyticus]|uniref:GrpB-like predicted nucleotidyltransferase (UPF0157 family) n=1 Tax=Paenibacillus endophyticus TaxID=1294268 RepID=A0A7W5CAR6_9BACL|nr:GrpB family protein [Paenibacillus endophyticus]MBB3153719.1 GrpB-like predicted nucleotidyltransferase (UPF0157 family) [Paenibacillus endophyticus]
MRKAEIMPWTENWNERFQTESHILAAVLEKEMIEIHHIGSTSVKQIGFAKPIIDLLVVVKNIHNLDAYNNQLESFGYTPRGENGMTGRRYFIKGGQQRTHHVHCHQLGDVRIDIHLNFKQYMIKHPDDAKAYGELKVKLAEQFHHDVHMYQAGKEQFLDEMILKAMKWAKKEGKPFA